MTKIYISSTYSDLIDFRKAVYLTLNSLQHDAVAMEEYSAADQRPLNKCLEDVAGCDIYVGIFAWRAMSRKKITLSKNRLPNWNTARQSTRKNPA